MNGKTEVKNYIKPSRALAIIIFFIISDIICENFMVIVNDGQKHFIATLLLFVFLFFQIFFSPIQAGISDSGRKKGLIISLSISMISVISIYLNINQTLPFVLVLFIATGLKGIWGNTLPISWAAIADTQSENNRGSYALASGAYAVSYLILIVLYNYSISQTILSYSVLALLIISLLLAIFRFRDLEDLKIEKDLEIEEAKNRLKGIKKHALVFWIVFKKEKFKILNSIKDRATRQALLAYLLWSISIYSILVSQIDLRGASFKSNHIAMAMMIGYLIGVAILKLKSVNLASDSKIIKLGYYISFFSLIPFFLAFPFISDITILLGLCYFLHALGNSFLSPAFLSFMSKENPKHEQGKILGLIESADTLAFMTSIVFVMIYNYFQLSLLTLICFSFLSFAFSFIYYKRFKIQSQQTL
ncbi:MAG: MFS transporter [Verrucomicrobia bacterium]|nr:MFS transporter [Verrucomicrobiota bacterium]